MGTSWALLLSVAGCGAAVGIAPPPPACDPPPGTHPAVLVSGQGSVTDIKVDGTYVYWANQAGVVSKASVCGGRATVLATTTGNSTSPTLALDAINVYFTSDYDASTEETNAISSVPKDGGPVSIVAAAEGATIADNMDTLVWGALIIGTPFAGSVDVLPYGGVVAQVTVNPLWAPVQITVDASNVYWMDVNTTLRRMPIGGGTIVALAQTMWGSNGLAVGGTNLYWTSYNQLTAYAVSASGPPPPTSTTSTVNRMPIGGGAVSVLATGWDFSGMAVDSTRAYWADVYLQTLASVPLSGGKSTVLATNEPVAAGPVIDDDAVYWATTAGDIVRVAKPAL